MTIEENKNIVRKLVEAYNSNNLDTLKQILPQIFHPSGFFRYIQSERVDSYFNVDELIVDHSQWLGKTIKLHNKILYFVVENDKVVLYSEKTVSYLKDFEGIPAGESAVYRVFNTYHIKDGKIYMVDRIGDFVKRSQDLGHSSEMIEIDLAIDRAQQYLSNLKTSGVL